MTYWIIKTMTYDEVYIVNYFENNNNFQTIIKIKS